MKIRIPKIKWRKPPEVRILDLLEKHVSLCISASKELVKVIEFQIAGHENEAKESLERLSCLEKEADNLRREIMAELAKGILPPLSREDLVKLVLGLDMATDRSRDAGRILSIISMDELTNELKDSLVKLTNKISECTYALGCSIKSLYKDYRKSLSECDKIERIEEDVDSIYIESLRLVYNSELKAQTSVLTAKLLALLESMADDCEDVADLIRVIVVSTFR